MNEQTVGKVLAIAIKTARNGPMRELEAAEVTADGGLAGDVPPSPARGVTFISAHQWRQVTRELGVDLPWHTRRANVLIETGSLAPLIGKTIAIGDVRVAIAAETLPCGYMDELHPGLKAALVPECRGGVYGRVLAGGRLARGDVVVIAPEE